MIAVLKSGVSVERREQLIAWLKSQNLDVHVSVGKDSTVLGLVGDTSAVDEELLESLDIVEKVRRVSEPFKKASRKFHPEDSVIDIGGVRIGGGHFCIIAGPCSIETEEQIIGVAKRVKAAGALKLLSEAKRETGLPIVTEIMNIEHLKFFDDVDLIQVGARNMQNFELLKELGHTQKPILLKRGLANTLQELLMSAEYIMAGGNENIILCERGIRTFETATRNTLDLSCVPVLHELTHLPVVVDPSHATGRAALVPSMSLSAAACGADGLMIEVHNDPIHALCDGAQSLTPDQFDDLTVRIKKVLAAVNC